MKSTAPRSRALKTLRSDEREDTAITAVGRFAISQRRKAKPSITGISRSSVITSGRCRITCRMPSSPLTAVATTSICGDDASIREIVTRLYAESSMTRARRASLLVHHVVLQVAEFELRRERDQRLRVAEEQVA